MKPSRALPQPVAGTVHPTVRFSFDCRDPLRMKPRRGALQSAAAIHHRNSIFSSLLRMGARLRGELNRAARQEWVEPQKDIRKFLVVRHIYSRWKGRFGRDAAHKVASDIGEFKCLGDWE